MTPAQRVERAQQAKQTLELVGPILDRLKSDYMASMAKTAAVVPLKVDTVQALAQAVRIVEVVREQIETLICEGEMAHAEIEYGRKIVEMTAMDRNLLNIAARRR